MEHQRPEWPYLLGAVGSGLFGFGMAVFLYVAVGAGGDASVAKLGLWTYTIGATMMGFGWLGIMKQGQAGFGVVGGSFAIPVSVVILKLSSGDDVMFAGAMLILVCMAFFAIGHVFVKNLSLTQFFAVPGALALLIQVVAVTAKWRVSAETGKVLGVIAFGSLAMIGFTLAFTLTGLRRLRNDT